MNSNKQLRTSATFFAGMAAMAFSGCAVEVGGPDEVGRASAAISCCEWRPSGAICVELDSCDECASNETCYGGGHGS